MPRTASTPAARLNRGQYRRQRIRVNTGPVAALAAFAFAYAGNADRPRPGRQVSVDPGELVGLVLVDERNPDPRAWVSAGLQPDGRASGVLFALQQGRPDRVVAAQVFSRDVDPG